MCYYELDERKMKILEMVIEEYTRTAEPVGSLKISKDLGYSSATIRNEMAELENLGLLEQPHTSAGRIPTTEGYRWYVDQVMKIKSLNSKEKAFYNALMDMSMKYLNNQKGYTNFKKTTSF